jgi:hypothetical protein
LIDLGYAAVPALIAALDDESFTRSVPPSIHMTVRVWRVNDVAIEILEHLAGRRLRRIENYARSPEGTRLQVEAWWNEVRDTGLVRPPD